MQLTETIDLDALEGKKLRILAPSINEAVNLLRARLGERARVLEVKTHYDQWWQRLFRNPQLEVIATVNPKSQQTNLEVVSDAVATPEPAESSAHAVEHEQAPPRQGSFSTLMQRMGFDEASIATLYSNTALQQLESKNATHALQDLIGRIREHFSQQQPRALENKIAFIGTPGCGKTTLLCKHLSQTLLTQQLPAQILKMDHTVPNADDTLRAFCDVWGLSLMRDPIDLDHIHAEQPLYVDTPGVASDDLLGWQTMRARLDQLHVQSRVFVLNAAYDAATLKEAVELARFAKATHLAFSHFDETKTVGKLWQPMLKSHLTPLCLSCGPHLTGSWNDKLLDCLIDRTFPAILLR